MVGWGEFMCQCVENVSSILKCQQYETLRPKADLGVSAIAT